MATVWIKELYPGGLSFFAFDYFPFLAALPFQYGISKTVWTIQPNLS